MKSLWGAGGLFRGGNLGGILMWMSRIAVDFLKDVYLL